MEVQDIKTPYAPLSKAMLLWNGNSCGAYIPEQCKYNIIAVEHCSNFAFKIDAAFDASSCACYSGWEKKTPVEQMLYLFVEALQAVARDGVDAKAAVRAISRVYELRYIFSDCTRSACGLPVLDHDDEDLDLWVNKFEKLLKSRKPNPGIYPKE